LSIRPLFGPRLAEEAFVAKVNGEPFDLLGIHFDASQAAPKTPTTL
jgi:hypothetical protein